MFGLDITNHAPVRKADYEQIIAVKTPITALYAEDMGNQYPAFNTNPDGITSLWDTLGAADRIANSPQMSATQVLKQRILTKAAITAHKGIDLHG